MEIIIVGGLIIAVVVWFLSQTSGGRMCPDCGKKIDGSKWVEKDGTVLHLACLRNRA